VPDRPLKDARRSERAAALRASGLVPALSVRALDLWARPGRSLGELIRVPLACGQPCGNSASPNESSPLQHEWRNLARRGKRSRAGFLTRSGGWLSTDASLSPHSATRPSEHARKTLAPSRAWRRDPRLALSRAPIAEPDTLSDAFLLLRVDRHGNAWRRGWRHRTCLHSVSRCGIAPRAWRLGGVAGTAKRSRRAGHPIG
jgi:hypothetical protein